MGVHHYDDATNDIEAERNEPPLMLGRVVDCDGVWVKEHALGIGEAYAVLAEVRLSFGRIPDRCHVCIIYACRAVRSIVSSDGPTSSMPINIAP